MKLALTLTAMLAAAPTLGARDITSIGVGYICGAEQTSLGGPVPGAALLLPGVGNGLSQADTANPEALKWYNQGLNLYHAFNHNEARVAFAKAAELDPSCALCEWGVALGLGPTLNYTVTPEQRLQALGHAERARQLLKPGDARAEGLITALLTRYGKDTPDARRETGWGADMAALSARFPDDNEVGNLAAHALLIPARADNFTGVAPAEAILKRILARKPDDTAAIHYYIHATEFAGHPAEALPYAERLAGLAPGASHLVHMAAHTMMHVGQYEQVALVDAQALKVDADVGRKLGYPAPLSSNMYYLHNFTFGLAGAMMAGDAPLALKYADHAGVAFPASFDKGVVNSPAGTVRMQNPANSRVTANARSLAALGRYAPDRALAVVEQPTDLRIQKIYRHYARGEAFATKGDAAGLGREVAALDDLAQEAKNANESGNLDVATIAGGVLAGRSAMMGGKPDVAITLFSEAAARQEKAFPVRKNFDPPPWWYPVRRSLAAAHLKAGHDAEAAKEARASLVDWPQDALALRVLSQAEARMGQAAAAKAHLAEARKAWRGDLAKAPVDLT